MGLICQQVSPGGRSVGRCYQVGEVCKQVSVCRGGLQAGVTRWGKSASRSHQVGRSAGRCCKVREVCKHELLGGEICKQLSPGGEVYK